MADTCVKVGINGGKVNVPGKDTIPATDTCKLETADTTAEDGLDCDRKTELNATVEAEEFDACELARSPE